MRTIDQVTRRVDQESRGQGAAGANIGSREGGGRSNIDSVTHRLRVTTKYYFPPTFNSHSRITTYLIEAMKNFFDVELC